MAKVPASLLLLVATASADFANPWRLTFQVPSGDPSVEERSFAWRDTGWVLASTTAHNYDSRGRLVHAEAWTDTAGHGRFAGTWSWDFTFDAGYVPTGIRERVLAGSGWRETIWKANDTTRPTLQFNQWFRKEWGAESDLDLFLLIYNGKVSSGSRTEWEIDASGRRNGYTLSNYGGGSWTVQTRSVETFDPAGRILSQVDEGSIRQTYAYDSAGNQIHYEWDSWKSGGWQLDQEETRQYDAEGRLALVVVRGRYPDPDGPVGLAQKIEHTYPAASSHEAAAWSWESGKWVRQGLTRERIDAHGNATESVEYAYPGAEPVQTVKTVRAFDAKNNLVDEAIFAFERGAWVLSDSNHTGYDANNREIESDRESFSEGIRVSKVVSAYRYDPRGKLLEYSSRQYSPSGAITDGTRVVYAYSGPSDLSRRSIGAHNTVQTGAARRSNVFLVRPGGSTRDLRGRIVLPRVIQSNSLPSPGD